MIGRLASTRRRRRRLKEQTSTDSLENAFLALTGSTIRDERADATDQLRQMANLRATFSPRP